MKLKERLSIGALVLGMGLCGCESVHLTDRAIKDYKSSVMASMEDPYEYKKYLKNDEYIVPASVFNAYAKTVDKRIMNKWAPPVGGYMHKNYLNTEEEQDEFRNRLGEMNLSDEDINFYERMFQTPEIIVFSDSILTDRYIKKGLPHERFHREIKKLSAENYKYMESTAKELLSRRISLEEAVEMGASPIEISVEKTYGRGRVRLVRDNNGGFYAMAANMHWEELWTYLAQGEFIERAEIVLKKEFPRAYMIFNSIKQKTKLKGDGIAKAISD